MQIRVADSTSSLRTVPALNARAPGHTPSHTTRPARAHEPPGRRPPGPAVPGTVGLAGESRQEGARVSRQGPRATQKTLRPNPQRPPWKPHPGPSAPPLPARDTLPSGRGAVGRSRHAAWTAASGWRRSHVQAAAPQSRGAAPSGATVPQSRAPTPLAREPARHTGASEQHRVPAGRCPAGQTQGSCGGSPRVRHERVESTAGACAPRTPSAVARGQGHSRLKRPPARPLHPRVRDVQQRVGVGGRRPRGVAVMALCTLADPKGGALPFCPSFPASGEGFVQVLGRATVDGRERTDGQTTDRGEGRKDTQGGPELRTQLRALDRSPAPPQADLHSGPRRLRDRTASPSPATGSG